MGDSNRALQHLTEARNHVDGDVVEMIDSLARVVTFNQDLSNPMLGAKVTVWVSAPTTNHREPIADAPEAVVEERDALDRIHRTRTFEDDGVEHIFWSTYDRPEWPDAIPVEGIVFEGNVAGDAPDGDLWDPAREEYRTADGYPLGTVNAVVPAGWTRGGEDALFSDGYCSQTEDRTSLVPADQSNSDTACYEPGWETAQAFHLDGESE